MHSFRLIFRGRQTESARQVARYPLKLTRLSRGLLLPSAANRTELVRSTPTTCKGRVSRLCTLQLQFINMNVIPSSVEE